MREKLTDSSKLSHAICVEEARALWQLREMAWTRWRSHFVKPKARFPAAGLWQWAWNYEPGPRTGERPKRRNVREAANSLINHVWTDNPQIASPVFLRKRGGKGGDGKQGKSLSSPLFSPTRAITWLHARGNEFDWVWQWNPEITDFKGSTNYTGCPPKKYSIKVKKKCTKKWRWLRRELKITGSFSRTVGFR